MGGKSFLLHKGFHPMRLDNQQKVFLAEENLRKRREREAAKAEEVMKVGGYRWGLYEGYKGGRVGLLEVEVALLS